MDYIKILDYKFTFPSSFLFLGKTNSGKTYLMKKILAKNRKLFDRVIVFCPIMNNDYNFLDKKYVLKDKEKLNDIIDKQYELKETNKHKPLLIILDDFIGSIDIRRDELFSKLATNGRHCNISTFYISQFLTRIPPVIRDNINYFIVLSVSHQSLDTLYEYQEMYNRNDLSEIYREIKKKPYRGLLFDNFKPYLKDVNKNLMSVIPFF
jgi:DNA helicase HerA-like ATPase